MPFRLPGGRLYAISIRGRVGPGLLAAFDPMQVSTVPGHTVLRGALEDQAALYGVLERIQSLGLELEEVRCLPTRHRHDAMPGGYSTTCDECREGRARSRLAVRADRVPRPAAGR